MRFLAIGIASMLVVLALATERSLAKASSGAAKFVSKRYGYSIVLAGQWRARSARTRGTGNFPLMDSGEVDV